MTINDIMLREIAEAEKAEREKRYEAELKQYDREIVRRLWRRRFYATIKAASVVLALATLMLIAWCVVSDTPHRRGFFGGTESRTVRECAPTK